MQRAHGHLQFAIRHLDAQAGPLQRFDLRRPLIDYGDVEAGIRQIRGNAAPDRTGAYYRNLFVHRIHCHSLVLLAYDLANVGQFVEIPRVIE
jgi:hypothetical protein